MTRPASESSDVEQAKMRLEFWLLDLPDAKLQHADLRLLLSSHERLTREVASCDGHGYLREEIAKLTREVDDVKRSRNDAIGRCVEAQKEVKRLRGVLLRRGISPAPCDICGHNGPGYHQPESHACIREADQQRAEARAIRESEPE